MAANEYYNSGPYRPQQPYYNYDDGRHTPQLPAYSAQGRPQQPSPSPFEAPFDDHVYPVRPQDSQNSFGQDSAYYGQGGRPQDSTSQFQDNIPLRPQNRKDDEGTDHVYDAAEAGIPPIQDDGRRRARGFGRFLRGGKIPWVIYGFTLVQVAVFIAEIVKNATLTGSPIEIHPSFNPMIGPSPYVLINMGSRYVPCMHNVTGIQDSLVPIQWPCPNSTSNDATDPSNDCTLSQLCGFNGVPNPGTSSAEPNQWFRFIIPMFLHAGIVHIGFNMLLQVTMGREMEKAIGSLRIFLVYVCSGIFGFVLGGNFAASGISSTGASGALFGIIALTLLDLLYTWNQRPSPGKDLAFIILDVVISFVLGLLPGLDNFSHIGGFFMGLVLGICIMHSPDVIRQRTSDGPPYAPVRVANEDRDAGVRGFVKAPVGFFKGRKPAWWAWWLLRAGALTFILIVFILLLNNFYVYRKTCSWCKYLSCLPINNWCDLGNLQITNLTSKKRDVFDNWDQMAKLWEVI